MHRRLLSASATCALLLGLAACGEPTDGPVTTAPPSISIGAPSDGGGDAEPSDGGGESPEPTAAAPSIPPPDPADYAGMDEHTAEGAEQAFRYYIAVIMWAHQTGDDSLIRALQSEECSSCGSFTSTFEELEAHNELWGEFTLTDDYLANRESDIFDVEVAYNFITSPHERPKDDFSGRVNVGNLEYSTVGGLTWLDGKWVIGGISAKWGNDVL